MSGLLCLMGFHRWGSWAPTQAVPFRRRICERCGSADYDQVEQARTETPPEAPASIIEWEPRTAPTPPEAPHA